MPELDGCSLGALVVPVIWILEIHKVILGVLVVPVIWILEIHEVEGKPTHVNGVLRHLSFLAFCAP